MTIEEKAAQLTDYVLLGYSRTGRIWKRAYEAILRALREVAGS